jgi:hypothetical protein
MAKKHGLVAIVVCLLLAVGAVAVAGAQSSTDPAPQPAPDELQQSAIDNAASPGAPSEGVPIGECPKQVEAMKAAGMTVSESDHIYPDCSAAPDLIQAWSSGQK